MNNVVVAAFENFHLCLNDIFAKKLREILLCVFIVKDFADHIVNTDRDNILHLRGHVNGSSTD